MRVIAVANQKGGVAKTTTALSLASSLALSGRRVLAIDLDPQENLTLGAGVDPNAEGPTLYEVLTQRQALSSAARGTGHESLEGLQVVPAGPRLAQAEGELFGQVGFDELLKFRLKAEHERWEFVVLDCPPSLGALTINALGAADLVLVPVQCEFFSARGVVKLLDVVELVRERRNPELAMRVVPTLYDQRNKVSRGVLQELRKAFGEQVSETVVGIDTRVRESQAQATPLCLYAPRSRASLAYQALACELERLTETPTETPTETSPGEVTHVQAA